MVDLYKEEDRENRKGSEAKKSTGRRKKRQGRGGGAKKQVGARWGWVLFLFCETTNVLPHRPAINALPIITTKLSHHMTGGRGD